MWIGILFMMGSMMMMNIVQGFLAYELTGSVMILGIVQAGMAMPMLILAPFGGAIADRVERKRVLQVGQSLAIVLAIGLGLLTLSGHVTWVYLFFGSLAQASLWSFMAPSRQSIIPLLVPREKMANAVALAGAGMSIASLTGPAVGGVLYALIGPEGVYFTVAGMGVVAFAFTTTMPKIPPKPHEAGRRIMSDIKEGLVYIKRHPVIRALLMAMLSTALLAAPLTALMPALIVSVYGRESGAFGLMLSASGLGSLIGALSIAAMGSWNRGLIVILSGFATAVTMLAVAVSPWYFLSVGFMAFMGLGHGCQWSLNQALGMGAAEENYRGRVMSVFMMSYGLTPLGVLPAGFVADIYGPQKTIGVMGVALVVACIAILATQRALRSVQ